MRRAAALLILTVALGACDKHSQTTATKTKTATQAQTTTGTTSGTTNGAAEVVVRDDTPQHAVKSYFAALASAELEQAYNLASSGDRNAKSLGNFESGAAEPVHSLLSSRRTIKITKTVVDGDHARVYVDFHQPDIATLQRGLLAKYIAKGKGTPQREKLEEELLDRMKQPDAPFVTSHQEIFVVHEKDGWRLDFDWDAPHPHREMPTVSRKHGKHGAVTQKAKPAGKAAPSKPAAAAK